MDNLAHRDDVSSKGVFFMLVGAAIFSPYSLCQLPVWVKQNGGASVLLPYCMCVLVLAIPLVFLELALGQFMQRAGTRIWDVVPLFKGISTVAMLVSVVKSSLNLVVASWAGFFLYLTITGQTPVCHRALDVSIAADNSKHSDWPTYIASDWPRANGSRRPSDLIFSHPLISMVDNSTNGHLLKSRVRYNQDPIALPIEDNPKGHYSPLESHSATPITPLASTPWNRTTSPCYAMYRTIWRQDILQASANVSKPGASVLPVFCGSLVAVAICMTLVIRGIKWTGKIMCVLTPMTFIATLALLVGVSLERNGSDDNEGLTSLLRFEFGVLKEPKMWMSSVQQVLVTHSLAVNVLPSLASLQRWSNNTLRDTWCLCVLVMLVNLCVSVSVCTIVGGLDLAPSIYSNSTEEGVDGLFLSLPMALSQMPHSTVWTVLYLMLLIVVAISSSAVIWESTVLSLIDTRSTKLRRWRVIIVIGVAFLSFLLTIPLSLQNGIYIYQFVDHVINGPVLVCSISLIHCLVIGIFYGGRQFYDNLETMTGNKPYWWIKVCWTYVCPFILLATIGCYAYYVHQSPLSLGSEPRFHLLANTLLGISVSLLLSPLVLTGFWVVCSAPGGCGKKLRRSLHPQLEGFQIPLRWRIEGTFHKFTSL